MPFPTKTDPNTDSQFKLEVESKAAKLEVLEQHLANRVVPVAQQLDRQPDRLFSAFLELGAKGWLAPKLPKEQLKKLSETQAQSSEAEASGSEASRSNSEKLDSGGLGLDGQEYQQFQSAIARCSGALAFLQTQHQSAASLILSGENEALKQRYLPQMATGDRCVGVGFSQLRRQPAPLRADPIADGYRLSGQVPWVTGAGLFSEFVGAAVLADGSAVFGLIPLVTQTVSDQKITVGDPMRLAAMSSMNTVAVEMEHWLLPAAQVVAHRPKGWIEERDRANPLSPLGLILGCAGAGIDVLGQSLNRRNIDHDIASQLKLKLTCLQSNLPEIAALPISNYAQKLALRGQAIALMNTCTQAAVIASSGAANTLDHPAQRVYGESMVFSVSGQTTDGAIATLDRLMAFV
ncbi:acyl-CoA dehydrogenase family protein [cf. Phormidesmis sp. LEGE 11477]|uniref:acyl-CoA dehydrogenase family protein n=1 Tax=cf. Phormidesmis sp. LEGE 11477 TaxID=1828680 RepID=UPI00187F96EF|nr:acyl-CoA dehydrogenase family protein [cf. Phormidesmis sp. LEGE 11477]MBE9060754.1 acyl-CoA dehydrogenase [cf. Phormidesmis sp. LEGE 11477]